MTRRALLSSALALSAQTSQERRVAVTIDDGPVVGDRQDLARFRRISNGLLTPLKEAGVPATIFINERQLNVEGQRDARTEVLAQWLDAGFDLANHTYSHPSLNRFPAARFEDDIVRGEVISRPMMEKRGRKLVWFRYPFLHSGPTADVHDRVVRFLEDRSYRIAPVTVDFSDYSFASAFSAASLRDDTALVTKIRDAYLAQADIGFAHAEKLSADLFGREIVQILLIHCNELNSVAMADLLATIRNRGYRFVTLDEAMKDGAYTPPVFAGTGGSWFQRTAVTAGRKLPPDAGKDVPKWVMNTR